MNKKDKRGMCLRNGRKYGILGWDLHHLQGKLTGYIHFCSQLIPLISHAFVFGTTCCFAEG